MARTLRVSVSMGDTYLGYRTYIFGDNVSYKEARERVEKLLKSMGFQCEVW